MPMKTIIPDNATYTTRPGRLVLARLLNSYGNFPASWTTIIRLHFALPLTASAPTISYKSYPVYSATVCKTVRPMLSDRCPVCPVCDVGVLWPNGWSDQDEPWHGGSAPATLCWIGTQLPPKEAHSLIFGPCPLWPNGGMNQDATWYAVRPRPRRLCVRWEPSSP